MTACSPVRIASTLPIALVVACIVVLQSTLIVVDLGRSQLFVTSRALTLFYNSAEVPAGYAPYTKWGVVFDRYDASVELHWTPLTRIIRVPWLYILAALAAGSLLTIWMTRERSGSRAFPVLPGEHPLRVVPHSPHQ